MNILILFSQPWRVGGAETHTEALIKGLTRQKHHVFLAVNEGSDEKRLQRLKETYSIDIIKIQARGINVFRWWSDIMMLSELIQREKIDIVTAQQRTAGIWANFLQRNTGIPYTVTMHDPWHRAKFKRNYQKIFPMMIAVSANLVDKLKREFKFPSNRIKLIHNGIDFEQFSPSDKVLTREKLGLDQEVKLILHVSRLSSVKGAVALKIIESMPQIIKREPNTQLIIIGEGPLRETIEKKAANFNAEYGRKIVIENFVDNIKDWYNAADILIGEGRVAMETLACNKAIVAVRNGDTFIGAIHKGNIAYACDVNFDGKDRLVNEENMAEAVMQAFKLPVDEIVYIAEYINSRLSVEKMTEDYLAAFSEVLAGGKTK